MEDHAIAAHHIADALGTIADNMPRLTPEQFSLLTDGLGPEFTKAMVWLRSTEAVRIRNTAPFQPLDDDERQWLFEEVQSELSDMSTRDQAREYLDKPEWMLRADYDDRQEYLRIEEEGE